MKTLGINLAWFWMFAFVSVGILGFIPNPVVGVDSFFITNTAHNLVHVLTGAGFTIFALMGNTSSILFLLGFGATYILVGLIGFFVTTGTSQGMLLGFIQINTFDNFLHLTLGIGILLSGIIANRAAKNYSQILSTQGI